MIGDRAVSFDAGTLVRHIAGYQLGPSADRWTDVPLPEDLWASVLLEAKAQRLTGFLMKAIVDGVLPTAPHQVVAAQEAHLQARALTLVLDANLMKASALLDADGIQHLVLKGPSFGHLIYQDVGDRTYGDIDLLVSRRDLCHAVKGLSENGFTLVTQAGLAVHRPGQGFWKGVILEGDGGFPLDLHCSLAEPPYGVRIDVDGLFATSDEFSVRGWRAAALGREERFLHACLHAVLEDLPPRVLRDICQALLAWRVFDWRHAELLMEEWLIRGIVALAVTSAFDALWAGALPLPLEWTRSYRPTGWERLALKLSMTRQRVPEADTFAAILGLRGIRAKASLARSVMVPSRDYINARYSSHRARWRAVSSSSIRLLREVGRM
jgi:hypothetical protein